MTQIQNFGFVPCLQELDVQHTPCASFRSGQSRREHEGHEHAFCHPYHTGAHGQGFGSDFPFGYYHQQLADGVVPAVQVFAPEGAGTAGHPVFRCVGGDIRQEDNGF